MNRFKKIATQVVGCLWPLGLILLIYSSFHFIIRELSEHVHYTFMIHADQLFGGQLPTASLQHWLWHGHVQWFDYVLYALYISHYILVIVLAVLIYTFRRDRHIYFSLTYIVTSSVGFVVDVVYPTAPPWLASQNGYIPHITRVTEAIFNSFGIHNYPALYSQFAPNPISAFPSLHAAYATLFFLFIYQLFGKKWAALSAPYPLGIFFGVVYMGEHYVIDVVAGMVLAVTSFVIAPLLWRGMVQIVQRSSFLQSLGLQGEGN